MRILGIIAIAMMLLACREEQEKTCINQMVEAIATDSISPPETFVLIDAKVNNKLQKVCLTHENLKWRIQEKFGLNEDKYKDYLQKFINHNDTLEFNNNIPSDYLVIPSKEMERLYQMGVDSLKEKYFKKKWCPKK